MREILLTQNDGSQVKVQIYRLADISDRDPANGEFVLTYKDTKRQPVESTEDEYNTLNLNFSQLQQDEQTQQQRQDAERTARNNERKLSSGFSRRETFVLAAIQGGRDLPWAEREAEKFIQEHGE